MYEPNMLSKWCYETIQDYAAFSKFIKIWQEMIYSICPNLVNSGIFF